MTSLWDGVRPLLGSLAGLSFFINLLFLVPALFMLQVFDRVLPSNSQETLLVLLGGTGVALLLLLLLDYVRTRLQHVVGNIVEERLSPPVVNAIVAQAARAPHSAGAEGVRDVAALRTAVLRQRPDRAVRRALGGGVRGRDLGVPPGARHRRRGSPRSSCSPSRGSTTASAGARWRACSRKGAAPRSTWRARCATRKCCRRSA